MAMQTGHKVEITRGNLAGRRGNVRNASATHADLRLDTGEAVEAVPLEALRSVRGRPFRAVPPCEGAIAFAG